MIAARSPRASFDDERRDDARQPNDGSTRAGGGAVPPPSPTRGAGHAGEATSSSALGKMQAPWQKMKHGVKDITRKLAMLKKPAVLDKFKPSSAPVNRPDPSSEGWVGAPGAAANPTIGARRYGIMDPRRYVNPNAPFGEQSDPPEGYAGSTNLPVAEAGWSRPAEFLVVYKRANRLGGPVDSSTSRTRPSWSPTGQPAAVPRGPGSGCFATSSTATRWLGHGA